jgi:hypothetical protein
MTLNCDGWCDKTGSVTHIDQAGFAYCTPCGERRRQSEPCRKLRPWELRKLERGEQLARY